MLRQRHKFSKSAVIWCLQSRSVKRRWTLLGLMRISRTACPDRHANSSPMLLMATSGRHPKGDHSIRTPQWPACQALRFQPKCLRNSSFCRGTSTPNPDMSLDGLGDTRYSLSVRRGSNRSVDSLSPMKSYSGTPSPCRVLIQNRLSVTLLIRIASLSSPGGDIATQSRWQCGRTRQAF